MFSTESLITIFNEYSNIAVIVSIILNIIVALIGVLPSVFITMANILFWGPIGGTAISLIGETVGAYITFRIYRLGLKSIPDKIKGKYKILDKLLVSNGLNAGILIFQGRVIPFIPSGFVTFAAAFSKVNETVFIIATFLGKIPSIALEGLISYDIINVKENYIRLLIVIFALLLGVFIKKKK
ncbi:VTT domain-containing protein [uncultured Clostridium sp.]|uniref:TVP38/TMEM64 family protein n=1 Tax=uncultured Clostridium sp. TaxID=59620 RepID=UPI0025F885E2|nr:VTT domain-containing protein [uncultured Clostridium sp.]